MELLRLLSRESPLSVKKLAGMAMLSGLANAMVLAVINTAAAAGGRSYDSLRCLLLFIITVTIYIRAQSFLMVRSTIVVESVLYSIRLRFIDLVRRADALPLEHIGRSAIYSSISKELVAISQATIEIVNACQASLMVFFAIAYLSVLSWTAFLITLSASAIGISIHFQKARERQGDIHEAIQRENRFLDLFTQMLSGFHEVKINRRVGDAVAEEIRQASGSLRSVKMRVAHQFTGHFIFSQAAFYVMIAAIVFLLPRFNESNPVLLTKTTSTILFIIGPLTGIMAAIPTFAMANVAVANVNALEERLASAMEVEPIQGPPPTLAAFRSIRFNNLLFDYTDEKGNSTFSVGPLNLEIPAGKTLFIVGGNGSGKSTFLRMLTGLYYGRRGSILLDGAPVGARNLQDYRNLFSVIFTDYHLFDQIYGASAPDPADVHALLEQFDLHDKVALEGTRWSTTALSTGQRKRLALIVSLLQQKPIMVFDEWAADQDPTFRKYFYEVLLPQMKAQGKTIIAATHDDRYFHLADEVFRMDFGQLEPWTKGAAAAPDAS
jgi:putative pyoverdin transport system ATP-binding/permease protein